MRTFDSRIDVRVLYKTCTRPSCAPPSEDLKCDYLSFSSNKIMFCAKLKAVQRKRKFDSANERSTNYLLKKQQNKRR